MRVKSPREYGLPPKFDRWRPKQEDAMGFLANSGKRTKVLCAPTGAGKSSILVADALASCEPSCIVVSSRGLADQYLAEFACIGMADLRGKRNYQCDMREDYSCEEGHAGRCPYKGTVACPRSQAEMRAATSRLVVTNYSMWTTAKKATNGLNHIKRLYLDEGHCFAAGTTVAGRPIEQINAGDSVWSFNTEDWTFQPKKVLRTFSREVSDICLVRFEDGRSLRCTPEHKIFTAVGWVRAVDCLGGFVLSCPHDTTLLRSLRGMSTAHQDINGITEARVEKKQEGLLQPLMFRQTFQGAYFNAAGKKDAQRTHESQQPDAFRSYSGVCQPLVMGEGTISEGGEWKGSQWTPESPTSSLGVGVENRTGNLIGTPAAWIPHQLQSRSSPSRPENSSRNRRQEPWCSLSEGAGSEKNRGAGWTRVDSVEVYTRGVDPEFAELCRDGRVYDIEIEDFHTFIAEGFVVHNSAVDALGEAMQVTLHYKEVEETLGVHFPVGAYAEDMAEWAAWAKMAKSTAETEMQQAYRKITEGPNPKPAWVKHFTHMRNLTRRLAILALARPTDWVVDELDEGYQFDPIRLGRYLEAALLMRVPSVTFASATIRPKTMYLLGIGKADFDFLELDSDFDPKRCPIYYVPTMRVDSRADDLKPLWVRLDQIASRRRDRKGIVQTVSFPRQGEAYASSRFAASMFLNEKGEAPTETIDEFRAAGDGAILVSPSVGTGYNFPMQDCEWQFLCKIPFEPPSKILKAREAEDKEYRYYRAMNKMVQIFGRGMRSHDDRCESFIGDSHLEWFPNRYGHLAPRSFHGVFQTVNVLPPPPERLRR